MLFSFSSTKHKVLRVSHCDGFVRRACAVSRVSMSVGSPSRSAGIEEAVVGPGFISPDHLVRVQIN